MKIAVVLAHPRHDSLNASIARTCVEHLVAREHDVLLRDLYAMDFDPRLKSEELPGRAGGEAAPDVAAERQRLLGVGGFVFVYPFWFNAPPAILKGYVDRVFGMGFGYGPGAGGLEPRLGGCRLLSISTSGAPDHWVSSTGALKALMSTFDLHLGAVCGLEVAGHHHIGGIVRDISENAVLQALEEARGAVDKAFPGR